MSTPVIDISDFQTVDSFHAVQSGGFGLVVCKATEGTGRGGDQDTFAGYRDRCRSINLPFGGYHFLSWMSNPADQVAHFLSKYTPQKGDFVPMLDNEACAVGDDAAIAQTAGFIEALEAKLVAAGLTYPAAAAWGGHPRIMLYFSLSFPNDHWKGGSAFAGHPAWVAAYNGDPFDTNIPDAWKGQAPGAVLWQYSDDIAVPGIEQHCDGDRFEGPDLKAFILQ
jgi:GH25 family lysozyme M1 (1,4-beta-N-acetylmuramidase)